MSRNINRKLLDFNDCCAGSVNGNFRRTSSLRLRGEKMVQRSPLTTRKFPVITENLQKHNDDVARALEPPHRQRSYSFSSKTSKLFKSHELDKKLNVSDSAHTPPGSPEDLPDDDSLNSYGSVATAASVDVDYAPFNGTTFSGRSLRYVLHCSPHAGLSGEEYLTPTQRAQRQIRRLKSLLNQAKQDLEKKDSEIFHLTKEVVELRLYKASLCSPDDKSNSSEIVTIRENAEDLDQVSPLHNVCLSSYDDTDGFKSQTPNRCRNNDMQGSFTDSGHFDDLTNSSLHSKESMQLHTHEASCMTDVAEYDDDRRKLIDFYEKKIEDLIRAHVGETQELKQLHNDKVEALLQKLADVNTRYCELVPNYEQARERISTLEKQLDDANQHLQDEESRSRAMYLKMYNKGVQAAKFEMGKDGEPSTSAEADTMSPMSRVSVEELLTQLQITQTELDNVKAMYRQIVESKKGSKGPVDPEITLQFLKSAIYYFLTDTDNHQGHLNAIENILGFTETERNNIRKARST